ncbi:MAG: phage tail length tape measure family protein [Erythrobacter sp.]|nr:phage tail length tape measure family protein [Erythrobacter sp.]
MQRDFSQTVRRIESAGRSMQGLGRSMSVAITAPMAALGTAAVRGFIEQERAMADVRAALASMGNASGRTAEQLGRAADAMEMRSLFDAEVILKDVTAQLLTFGNISGTVFDRAQQAAVDMATRLGQEPQQAAIQLARALNDPANQLSALGRTGTIQRDWIAANQERIRAMVAEGRVAEAQGLILNEVERQYRGAAQAAADATPWRQAQVAIGQAMDTIGAAILPVVQNVAEAIASMARAFSGLSPFMQQTVIIVAALAAAFGPVLIVTGSVISSMSGIIASFRVASVAAAETTVASGVLSTGLMGLRAAILSVTLSLAPLLVAAGLLGGLYLLVTHRSREVREASERYNQALEESRDWAQEAAQAEQGLAAARGEARVEALRNVAAMREETREKIRSARASLIAAQAELARARAFQSAQNRASIGSTGVPGTGSFIQGTGDGRVAAARENLITATETLRQYVDTFRRQTAELNAPVPEFSAPGVSGAGGGSGQSEAARTAEIQRRFNDELIGYGQQSLSAMQQMAMSGEESAELEMRSLEWRRRQALEQIAADEDYTQAQKDELALAVEALADHERAVIEFRRRADMERERADLQQVEFDRARDELGLRLDMADTQAERRDLALELLALEQRYRRSQLEAVVASETASDAERQRAQMILDGLAGLEQREAAAAGRANETDVQRYLRELRRTPAQMREAMDGVVMDGLDSLNRGLADAIVNFRSLGDVARNVLRQVLADLLQLQIRQALIAPLAQFLGLAGSTDAKGSSGGGLSGLFSSIGNAFGGGKAVGGPVSAGKFYLVGERGPELFAPGRSGAIVPNGAMGGGLAVTVTMDPSTGALGAFVRDQAGRVVATAAPALMQGGAALAVDQIDSRAARSFG